MARQKSLQSKRLVFGLAAGALILGRPWPVLPRSPKRDLGPLAMHRTFSEKVFEEFCATKGITCLRIAESDRRTPDYELVCGAERIIVEVKEITSNKEEQESDRLLTERGYGNVLSHTPGDRVRKKIADCSAQIKGRTGGKHASLLVVFDRGRGHIDPYNIRVAMYGLEQIHIAVPPLGMGSPHSTGMGYGPKRKMTPDHNTSISAIGALFMTRSAQALLYVYHNKFAQVPLKPALLAQYGVEQFELEDETIGITSKWREIGLAAEP